MLNNIFFFIIVLIAPLLGKAQTVGVLQNDSLAFNGYTLFSPAVSKNTYLVDNCGHLVKSWESEYRPNYSSYLLEDGCLLRAINIPANTQNGFAKGGIEKFSWYGSLIWQYSFVDTDFAQHHDIEPMPNGNILVIVFEEIPREVAIANGRDPDATTGSLWPEKIIELKPFGDNGADVVWEWRVWDHLIQDFDSNKANYGVVADHPEKIDVNFGNVSNGDWLHFNSIDYNEALDQIVVSSRTFEEIFIIDHSTSIVESATSTGGNAGKGGDLLYRWGNPLAYDRGTIEDKKFFGQHNAHWIEDGLVDERKLMVFNNGIQRPAGIFSTVDILDPPFDDAGNYFQNMDHTFGPSDLSWTYESTDSITFYSSKISGAQRLPNGNTMICEGNSSRLFEVTYDGEIVWEYISPINVTGPIAQGEILASSSIFRSLKYAPDYPAFEDVNLVAGQVLELDPWPSDCQIYTTTFIDTTEIIVTDQEFPIAPNPVFSEFSISNKNETTLKIEVYSVSAKKIFSTQSSNKQIFVNAASWPKGCYFIRILNLDDQLLQVSKLIR